MARLPLRLAFCAVLASVVSFVATLDTSLNPTRSHWGWGALNSASEVLIFLALASALVFERRASARAAQLQIAAAAISVVFVIVALVKLYSASYFATGTFEAESWLSEASAIGLAAVAFGLIGFRRADIRLDRAFALAVCVTAGCAIYAISLEGGFKNGAWWGVTLVFATLAASAAARMHRR